MKITAKLDTASLPDKSELDRNIKAAIAKAMDKVVGGKIYPETQLAVPVRTGALKASGRFIPAKDQGLNIVASSIEYGGEDVDYAVIVHEDLNDQHTAPTMAKFVEIPLAKHKDELALAIKAAVLEGIQKSWPGAGGGNFETDSSGGTMGGMGIDDVGSGASGGAADMGELF